MQTRINRVAAARRCSPDEAFRDIARQDLARQRFVRSHFDSDLEDPHQYDLVINTDHHSAAMAARIVVTALHEQAKNLNGASVPATASSAHF